MFRLVGKHQHTFANRSHVKYEFTNTKKLVKKLARIEASSICHQQFANMFADCFYAVHTHQLEFANTSLPTLVCRVKAALICILIKQQKHVAINNYLITHFTKQTLNLNYLLLTLNVTVQLLNYPKQKSSFFF